MAYIDLRNRAPKVDRLPDTRLRVTYVFDVLNFVAKTPADLLLQVWLAWGTQDVKYTACRLIKQDITGQLDGPAVNPEKDPVQLVRIYEEIPESAEIQVGNNEVIQLKDGRIGIKAQFLQFSTATATPGTVNVTTAPGVATAFMLSEDAPNDGTLRRIERIYETAGVISQNDEIKYDGALLIRSIVSVHTAPATPAGYTLISQHIEDINGFPTFQYTFALGTGQISLSTEYEHSPDQGTTGITRTTIKYLTTPAVSSNPTTGPGGSELISVEYNDQDGYRLWSVVYASGQGIVETQLDIRENGKLIVYSITSINAVPSAPAPTIGGTVVLIKSDVENGQRVENGTLVYHYQWAEGYGLIAEAINSRTDGLREVTWVSLGVRLVPTGIDVIRDDRKEGDGYTIYTVTSMQTATGGDDITEANVSFERYENWTYPGRAQVFSVEPIANWPVLDVYLSPPVQTQVKALVSVTYQTTNDLGTIANYWAPKEWATLRADWIDVSFAPLFAVRPLTGYVIYGTPSITVTVDQDPIYSSRVLGIYTPFLSGVVIPSPVAYDVSITLEGGPSNPGGTTVTLDAFVSVAFTASDGTVYYRKTIVTADIPAQPALPVLA